MEEKIIAILIALLCPFAVGTQSISEGLANMESNAFEKTGIFSWNYMPGKEDATLLTDHEITEVYQYFRSSYTDEEVADYLTMMKGSGIDVYILDGEPEWCSRDNRDDMRKVLERMDHYNTLVSEEAAIKGVVFDVEPYLLSNWKDDGDQKIRWLRKNIEALKEENDAIIYVCIPYFYDSNGYSEQLEKLVNACDGIFVMNYYRDQEIPHIETETGFAAMYNKRFVNLYELKPHGDNAAEDKVSYYYEGLDKVRKSIESIRSAYPDIRIDMGYHDIKYFKELINQ